MSTVHFPVGSEALERRGRARKRPLRFANFLAPNLHSFYAFVTRYVGRRCGCSTELLTGTRYDQLDGPIDVAVLCGLPYIERSPDWEPLAAPVLHGDRYRDLPIYFSDVIVRRDCPFRTFADLRGCRWSYNELHSHSGYGVVRYRLAQLGETHGYFGKVIESGWHEESIRMVCSGRVDASAIDSHVLAIALRDRPRLIEELRIIDSFGPSSIQPIVARRSLPARLKLAVRETLASMHHDAAARKHLRRALVQHFVPVADAMYDDIRRMRAAATAVDL